MKRWVLLGMVVSGVSLAQDSATTTTPSAAAPPPAAVTPAAVTPAPPPPLGDASPVAPAPIPDAPPPAAALPAPTGPRLPPVPLESVAEKTWIGAHAAANIGLVAVDLHVRRSYTFLAGNLGVPLVTNGDIGAFALGSGYSFPLSPPGESMWVMDLFGVVNPGWQRRYDFLNCTSFACQPVAVPFFGLGVGLGFRYLHWSGFTFGIKGPVFGAAINGGDTTSAAVGMFYLANLIGLPVLSFGYRW